MTRVFHCRPERRDAPPAQRLRGDDQDEHRPAQPGQERPVQHQHLGHRSRPAGRCAAAPSTGSARARLDAALSQRQRRLRSRRRARRAARAPTSRHQHRRTRPCCSRRSPPQQDQLGAEARAHREQHPRCAGRRAAASASVSARTCSTEDDDRLPTCGQRAPGASQRAGAAGRGPAPSPPGPSGRRGAPPRCRCRRSELVVAEEAGDVVRRGAPDQLRHAGGRARSGSRCRRRPSPSRARCPGTAGCGWPRPAGRAGPAARRAGPPPSPRPRRRRRTGRWRPGWPSTRRRAAG